MKARVPYRWLVLMPLLGLIGCQHIGSGSIFSDRTASSASLQPAAAQAKQTGNHYQAARAAFLEGNAAKAELEVKLALQENALDAKAHFLFACLLEQRGENDQAIVGFQRVVAIEPNHPEAHYNLGTLLLRRGEAVAAVQLLEKAVLIRPDHVPSCNNLAKAYFLADLPELAVATYQEALRRDSSNDLARKNLELLSRTAGDRDEADSHRQRPESLQLSPVAKLPVDGAVVATKKPPVAPARAQEAGDDWEANHLQELLRDLPFVRVERRGGRLILTGWTCGPNERALLDRILGRSSAGQNTEALEPVGRPPDLVDRKAAGLGGKLPDVLDLTTDDAGDQHRMIEIDAVILEVIEGPDQQNCGFNFLQLINLNFNYFASDSRHPGTGYTAPAGTYGNLLPPVTGPATGAVTGLSQSSWIMSAAANYNVNIANADIRRVAFLAQPHLTALSGTQAKTLAGGELIYRVSGINSGDIKPYPFGTTLNVTPTLLRTPDEEGRPRVHVVVEVGRTSILSILTNLDPNLPTAFDKLSVSSQATLNLGQTLILSGLSQRERRTEKDGVPGLMSIPILKYLFSTETTIESKASVLVLLTLRDPAHWGRQNQQAIKEFIEKRRAFIQARQGTEQDMQCFRERYADWDQLPPNRFITHVFLTQVSEIYRTVAGTELTSEDIDLELLGPGQRNKKKR